MPFPNPVGPSGRFQGPDKSQGHRDRADFIGNLALFALTAPIGGGLVRGVGSRLQPITSGLSFVKRPIHTTLAWRSQWNQPVGKLLNRTLIYRKKVNQLALGYSLLNPTQNITYALSQDWKRLAINLHSPIIGVPIYELYSRLVSGQPAVRQPSGPPIRNSRQGQIRNLRQGQIESEQLGSRGAPTSARTAQPTWAKRSDRASARSRTAAQPFLKKRRYCKRHGKYDLCHRRRW